MTYLTGRRDTKQSARDAIVTLRQNLAMLEKKQDYTEKKIEEELKKAKANAVSNKAIATQALRRKKQLEAELDRLSGQRMTLETQVNAIESANINAETMAAMKKGADVLKIIHGNMNVDKVDQTMDSIREQLEIADEITQAISSPLGPQLDEDELKTELAELEQDELNQRLMGADSVPTHAPSVSAGPEARRRTQQEEDEEEELRELQAQLAM